ncbi:Replicative DNA helicase DnaB [Lysobacter dokdonensis DS-58]|uniref:DNA 5'-3' helicase n=1 Tax=Lysobacter dokdonensis DS-58 TaxID=1300345 RepID=A0A0A2WNM0_9GAMM|nr:DnaB-like helicase C-terminal domain-containing protein [Lysobacter dokdonensis]KGQ19890.1 Replicative DNA helicase DnaB [Lysobacter dokdonensis DS-58]
MSVAAENVVGGILLAGRDAYWRVAPILSAEDFPSRTLADLYRICGEVAQSSAAWDFFIVADEAERQGVCSSADVIAIASATGSAVAIRDHAERVKSDAVGRRVRAICADGAKTGDVATVQAQLTALLLSQPASAVPARDALNRMWAGVMARYESGDALSGIQTGIPLVDEMTGGLQAGRVYGIGARAKMGKTILAMNVCANIACPPVDNDGLPIRKPRNVAAWSLEMSDEELMQRMASAMSGTRSVLLQRPTLLDDEPEAMTRLNVAIKTLREAPLRISDRTDVTIEQIESQARQMHAGGELDLLCIDYLGLLRMPKMDRHDLSVAHCTRRIKIIAKELRIPVLLVFQLNRGSENGMQVRPPRPSDARDSGAIEQDLDAMFLLHRPSYYDKNAPKGLRLDLAIQRNGPTGLIHMNDELDCCRFTGGASHWTDAIQSNGGRDDDL